MVVEDGSGVINANSYVTTQSANTYFSERGVTAWLGTQLQKEQALIKATDYIEMRFAGKFCGTALTTTQTLSFPRSGLSNTMPPELTKACCEYALVALAAPLAPNPTRDPNILSERKKLDVLEKDVTYRNGTQSVLKQYPQADLYISRLICSNNGNRVIR